MRKPNRLGTGFPDHEVVLLILGHCLIDILLADLPGVPLLCGLGFLQLDALDALVGCSSKGLVLSDCTVYLMS